MSNKSKVKSVGGVVLRVEVGIDNPSVDLFGRHLPYEGRQGIDYGQDDRGGMRAR